MFKRITSAILLLFLFAFNLAIPLPDVQAEDTGMSCSLKCGCPSAEKCCCCKKTIKKIRRPDPGYPCFRDAGCADMEAEGIICPALNHAALLSEERPPVLPPSFCHAGSGNIAKASIFLKPIEKPPRTFLS